MSGWKRNFKTGQSSNETLKVLVKNLCGMGDFRTFEGITTDGIRYTPSGNCFMATDGSRYRIYLHYVCANVRCYSYLQVKIWDALIYREGGRTATITKFGSSHWMPTFRVDSLLWMLES